MTKRDAEQQQEFIALLYREFPDKEGIVPFARELMRLARKCAHFAEAACGELSPRQAALDEANDRRIEELCEAFGASVLIQGDPRGFTVKLLLPSGSYNTWGGHENGWGVPGS